jgi:hypothetical protein
MVMLLYLSACIETKLPIIKLFTARGKHELNNPAQLRGAGTNTDGSNTPFLSNCGNYKHPALPA